MTQVQDVYPGQRVSLREVGLRDGLQLVKTFPTTAAKQRWICKLSTPRPPFSRFARAEPPIN